METITIKVKDYYSKPEYYPYMPQVIFDALELAELKGELLDGDVLAEVPKDDFNRMIFEYNNAKKR